MDKKKLSYLYNVLFLLADSYENSPEEAGKIVAASTRAAAEALYPDRNPDDSDYCESKLQRTWLHRFSSGFLDELIK